MMPVSAELRVEIRRGDARFVSRGEGYRTRHSFSFGAHYDPANTGFGPLVCHDDHLVGTGAGFADHPHRGVDIVTWVLAGALEHRDSAGHTGIVRPGQVQVLRAGSGVTHSETAAQGPLRFVQAWLTSADPDAEPAYAVHDVAPRTGLLTEAVSLDSGAALHVARLAAGDSVTLPDAPLLHVFVASGALIRSSLAEPLAEGDAFRITRPTDPGPGSGSGHSPTFEVTAAVPTELLVWTLPPRG